jgi:hypothetical protein
METKRVIMSRDVHCLDQNYMDYKKSHGLWDPTDKDNPDNASEEEEDQTNIEDNMIHEQEQEQETEVAPTGNNNHVSWADVAARPATRSVTRTRTANFTPLVTNAKPNAKLIRQMAKLSGPGIYENPAAEQVVNEATQQEQALNNQQPKETNETNET